MSKKHTLRQIRYQLWGDGNLSVHHFPGASYPWEARWQGGIPFGSRKAQDLTKARLLETLAHYGMNVRLGRLRHE
jgi:hypothetical protein